MIFVCSFINSTVFSHTHLAEELNLTLPTIAEDNDIDIEYLKTRGIKENVISSSIEKRYNRTVKTKRNPP